MVHTKVCSILNITVTVLMRFSVFRLHQLDIMDIKNTQLPDSAMVGPGCTAHQVKALSNPSVTMD